MSKFWKSCFTAYKKKLFFVNGSARVLEKHEIKEKKIIIWFQRRTWPHLKLKLHDESNFNQDLFTMFGSLIIMQLI